MTTIRLVDHDTDDVVILTICSACGEEGHDAPAALHDPETGELRPDPRAWDRANAWDMATIHRTVR